MPTILCGLRGPETVEKQGRKISGKKSLRNCGQFSENSPDQLKNSPQSDLQSPGIRRSRIAVGNLLLSEQFAPILPFEQTLKQTERDSGGN